jgi:hypothetical protein
MIVVVFYLDLSEIHISHFSLTSLWLDLLDVRYHHPVDEVGLRCILFVFFWAFDWNHSAQCDVALRKRVTIRFGARTGRLRLAIQSAVLNGVTDQRLA